MSCVWGFGAASAQAAPPLLWQGCETGSAAGQCQIPRGIAVNPSNGHLYVADQSNRRVDELDVWGQLVKAWGWGVRNGTAELQTCTTATGCQAGLSGSGAGQFEGGKGVALDSTGDVYVVDNPNHRVQKFDPEGHFLLMFGGDVNKTKVEAVGSTEAERNLCTAASADVCQVGSTGSGAGQFGVWPVSSLIAIGPGDVVYVGDVGRIQRFDTAGHYQGDLPDPEGLLSGETVGALTVVPAGAPNAGDLYLSRSGAFEGFKDGVIELNPGGEELCTAPAKNPSALASDSVGDLYTTIGSEAIHGGEIRKFGPGCVQIESFPAGLGAGFPYFQSTGIATSSACGINGLDIYAANSVFDDSFIRAFGPAPDPLLCPPPKVAPTVTVQYATSVFSTSATLEAQINPHFWPDTTYYVEYGTGKCSEGGCPNKALFPGAALGGGAVDASIPTNGASILGLSPASEYRYRFVAESGGGGPVSGAEGTFNTLPPPRALRDPDPCSNAAFRSGPSANLPHCRAYEMVSPIDKEGGDIAVLHSFSVSRLAHLDQASENGERVTFSSFRAFGDADAAPYTSQYLASRQPGQGWSTEPISPPAAGPSIYLSPGNLGGNTGVGIDTHYKAFSDDLCQGWVMQETALALTRDAVAGFPNLYRRQNCGTIGLEALTTVEPQVVPSDFVPAIEGFSADGSRAFFTAKGALTTGASGARQLYERLGSQLSAVCILPSGAHYSGACSLGTADGTEGGARDSSVLHAVSSDGSRVFWSDADKRLYLRKYPERTQSNVSAGKCTEVEKSCTVAVSQNLAFFWSATADGSTALFGTPTPGVDGGEDLFTVAINDKNVKTTTEIAQRSGGVLGAGKTLKAIYLTSQDVLSTGANSEGATAQAGKANVYLYNAEDGGFTFIATLSTLDDSPSTTGQPSPVAHRPTNRTARVTPDGRYLVFESTAPLTGYDNTDQHSGEADAEVFLYDAGTQKLVCVSCNPTGARPVGRQLFDPKRAEGGSLFAAALIPGWEDQLHPSRVLSDSGEQLFFESFEPLVLRDTNGARDVYEWEPGTSQEDCEKNKAAELFVPSSGGCISLISSGESPSDSSFLDASADGRDVFFTTASSLLPQDPGLVDVYDAREGGGFALASSPAACEGEACQGPFAPPNDPTPASAAFNGAGNVKAAPSSCRKGKVHRKGRCIARKKHKHGKRANRNRRAAR